MEMPFNPYLESFPLYQRRKCEDGRKEVDISPTQRYQFFALIGKRTFQELENVARTDATDHGGVETLERGKQFDHTIANFVEHVNKPTNPLLPVDVPNSNGLQVNSSLVEEMINANFKHSGGDGSSFELNEEMVQFCSAFFGNN